MSNHFTRITYSRTHNEIDSFTQHTQSIQSIAKKKIHSLEKREKGMEGNSFTSGPCKAKAWKNFNLDQR